MVGLALLRLIMNSSAALRTYSASSSSTSSSTGPPFGVGGNVKVCVPGKGLTTIGIGPESADGMIRAGRKENRACRCRADSCRWDVVRGVRMMRNFGRWAWESEGRVSSIRYMSDEDYATWC